MANVDLTLRLTNPQLFNQLNSWVTNGMKVKLDLEPNIAGGAKGIKQQIAQQLGPIPVDIDPKLKSVTQLKQQIQQAIGNVSINITIANLAQLNQQVQQIFTGLGIPAPNVSVGGGGGGGRPATKVSTRALINEFSKDIVKGRPSAEALGYLRSGTLLRSVGVQLGRRSGSGYSAIQSRASLNNLQEAPAKRELERSKNYFAQIRRGTLDLSFPQHLNALEAFAQQHQGTVLGDKIQNTLQQLRYANEQAANKNLTGGSPRNKNSSFQSNLVRSSAQLQRRQERYQDIFENEDLLDIAIYGPQKAARNFERQRALQAGTVNESKVKRFSFDTNRVFDPSNFREIAISGAVGGFGGGIGGALGASAFGRAGIYGGALLGQVVQSTIIENFQKLAEAIKKASDAGLEFQKNVLGIASVLSTTQRVSGVSSDLEAVKFQRQQAQELLTGTRKELSPLGIGQTQQAALLRGVLAGASEGGFNLSNEQAVQITKLIGGTTAAVNEDLLQQLPRLVNDVSDLLSGAPTAGRSELGQQYRRILPDIKAAISTGDTEQLIAALKKYDGIIKTLTLSTDSAAVAFRKYNAITQELETSFGEAFNQAIVPGLNAFNQALSRESTKEALLKLGDGLGDLTSALIGLAALNLTGIVNFFNDLTAVLKVGTVPSFDNKKSPIQNIIGAIQATGLSKSIPGGDKVLDVISNAFSDRINGKAERLPEEFNQKFVEKYKRNVDTGTRSGRYLIEQANIAASPEFSDKVKLAMLERSERAQSREERLSNINQLTPQGKLQADLESLKAQKESETISSDVFEAQKNTLLRNFGISQTLAGTNQQTIAGSTLGSILGITQNQISGGLSPEVATQQRSAALVAGIENLVGSFYSLQKNVMDASQALSGFKGKLEESKLTLRVLIDQQQALADKQKLNSLQGLDKLYALRQQVEEAGGTVDLGLSSQIGLSAFNSADDQKERQRKILEQQFKYEAESFLGQGNRDKLEKRTLQNSITGIQNQIQGATLEENLLKVNQNKAILDFAQQFGEDKTKEVFSKEKFEGALNFFKKDAQSIADIKSSGDAFKRALDETFGASYFSKMGETFKQAIDGVF